MERRIRLERRGRGPVADDGGRAPAAPARAMDPCCTPATPADGPCCRPARATPAELLSGPRLSEATKSAPLWQGNSPPTPASDDRSTRPALLARALRLEYLTVGWNVIEGAVAVAAALAAGSVALLGFGIDSFVECSAGLILIWRLSTERRLALSAHRLEQLELRARRLVAGSLFLLAAYVGFDAVQSLLAGERPSFSLVGSALLVISIAVMRWLAGAKRQVARALGSRALEADAFQTTACWWLSLAALAGIGLNGALGWWWADPIAGLAIASIVVHEGRQAWRGHACC